jgi:hypothetical protein
MPTRRQLCPKHGTPVGAVTNVCLACRDELYERLADEFTRQGYVAQRKPAREAGAALNLFDIDANGYPSPSPPADAGSLIDAGNAHVEEKR